MPLTPVEFSEIIALICPHCRAGHKAVQRADTKEWTHTIYGKNQLTHSICWATGFLNSRFNIQTTETITS